MTDRLHNNPPDPIEEICSAFEADRLEAENWLDGSPVENEAQMNEVDKLRKAMREFRLDLERGQKSEAAPLHDQWKAALARWKPPIEDAQRIEKGLVAAVDAFKRKLADEKRAAERAAWEAAEKLRREAEEAARAAVASDIEAQREAAALQQAVIDAEAAAQAARKDTVKGMVTKTFYKVTDGRALINWIVQNDREAVTAFLEEYARKNHSIQRNIDGVDVWQEKVAR